MAQSTRYRSYSRDSVPYPSESSSSLSGYHTGNRSRANTSDSSSISSSDYNSSATGRTASRPVHTNRRRSHRPRGCRGGRKNRKNKDVPKEIVGGNIPLCPRENIRANGDNKNTNYHPSNHFWDKQRPHPADENRSGSSPRPMVHPSFSQMQPPINMQKHHHYPNAYTFHPINNDAFYMNGNIYNQSMGTGPLSRPLLPGEILPPLPATKEETSPSLDGPNPYALSANSNRNTIKTNKKPKHGATIVKPDKMMDEYRTQRIEKQRQMLADGGSLFVTSPRTFLMGGARKQPVGVSW